jgi:Mce-associated membrane protein
MEDDAVERDCTMSDVKVSRSVQRRKVRRRSVEPALAPATVKAKPRRRVNVNALLAVLLAVVTALAATATWRWYEQREVDRGLQAALAAGKQAAINFVSIGASTVDRDMQRILDAATGDFKDEYERNRTTFRDQVAQTKAESTGTVLRAGLLSGDSDSAVVLVALDATIKNANAPDGRLSHYRMQLDMAKDARTGRWLVSRLQFVG